VLESYFGHEFTALRTIQDLFYPELPQGIFSTWYSFCIRKALPPSLKIYLNLQCQGAPRSLYLCKEALARLGLEDAHRHIVELCRDNPLVELKYFALDICGGSTQENKRTKIYLTFPNTSFYELQTKLSAIGLAAEESKPTICNFGSFFMDVKTPVSYKPLFVCININGGVDDIFATVYFPISHYTPSDLHASNQIFAYLNCYHSPAHAKLYERCLSAVISRPLLDGIGQSYVSFKLKKKKLVSTVYFSAECNKVLTRKDLLEKFVSSNGHMV